MSIILDAGPCLNFLAVGQQNVLIQLAADNELRIEVPGRVDTEVHGKAKDRRFERTGALNTWKTLKSSGRIKVLDDTLSTDQFTDAVTRISGMPAAKRIRDVSSLGEILVLAHASVYAQRGTDVYVLIDEKDGRARAAQEKRWLELAEAPGTLTLWGSRQVLREAGNNEGWLKNGLTWEQVYDQMTEFDEALTKSDARRSRRAR